MNDFNKLKVIRSQFSEATKDPSNKFILLFNDKNYVSLNKVMEDTRCNFNLGKVGWFSIDLSLVEFEPGCFFAIGFRDVEDMDLFIQYEGFVTSYKIIEDDYFNAQVLNMTYILQGLITKYENQ